MEITHRDKMEAVQHSTSSAAHTVADTGSTVVPSSRSAMARCRLQTTDRMTRTFPAMANAMKEASTMPTGTARPRSSGAASCWEPAVRLEPVGGVPA
ncbi:hypothetical protein EYF80_043808 [Liparis tanakae]|uniref:Uncharacterized protein n=1 Tax=Liparis tanakae TaxID=230148 RepID=A0A4Z2FXQ2_9TELE|nr:hypothetical protein EYF80_043808 [Liparis tanakae]